MHMCIHVYTRAHTHVYIRHRALEERKGTKCVSNVQWSWSGRWFELIIGTTPPPAWALPGALGPLGFVCFFDIVLASFFFRFWCQLDPNLAPNLSPKSTKNLSKSHPKSIPTCILFSIAFWLDLVTIF